MNHQMFEASHLWAAMALNLTGAIGCAWIADNTFTRLGRLVAGSFAIALSIAAIGILLSALEVVLR